MLQSAISVIQRKKKPLLFALLPWFMSFFLETNIIEAARSAHLFTYAACKSILFAALFLFAEFLLRVAREPKGDSYYTFSYALPYFLILLCWLFWKHPLYLYADELNLFTRAKQLDSFAYWFNYFSGYYWITCIMLLPFELGPIVVKLILHSLAIGYCLTRLRKHSGNRMALLLYLPFLQPFVLDLGVSAHRLPLYGILYLFFAAKLFFDYKEHRSLDRKNFLLLSLILGVLSFWRTEGIYLTLAGAVLILVAYRIPVKHRLRSLLKPAACYILILLLVALPQLDAYTEETNPPVSLRTAPLCGYALGNMLREGLTEEDIGAADYAAIDAYLPFEEIRSYNETMGRSAYAYAQIMEYARPNASLEEQGAFCDAVKHIIIQHPFLYLKTQWQAFHYTSYQYRYIEGSGTYLRYASYRQWLPLFLNLAFALYALIRKRYMTLLLTLCALINWGLVVALMPAAYAKYFYVDYLLGFFFLFVGLCCLPKWKKERIYE